MGKEEGLTVCPHCGGENGYHTKEIVEFRQFYNWMGDYLCGEHVSSVRGGNSFYCCDCGRNITKHVKAQRGES